MKKVCLDASVIDSVVFLILCENLQCFCFLFDSLTDVNRRMSISGQFGRSQSYAPSRGPTITPPTVPHSQQSHPRNPYNNVRNRTSNSAPQPKVGRNWDSTEAQPHLNRRRRVDREFGGVALDTIRGDKTEKVNEDFPIAPPVSESNAAPVYQTIHNSSNNLILLDSDDDDELLDYSVFTKK